MKSLTLLKNFLFLSVSVVSLTHCNFELGNSGSNGGSGSDDPTQFSQNDETSLSDCDTLTDGKFLVNGKKCAREDYDYSRIAAVLFYPSPAETSPDGNLEGVCTGALISPSHVLTAAHCLKSYGSDPDSMLVEINSNFYEISATAAHPEHRTLNAEHDLAVLTLSQRINETPFPLAEQNDVQLGDVIKVFGFGSESYDDEDLDAVIKVGRMTVEDIDENWFLTEIRVSGVSPCFGDSGGPALASINGEAVIVGVVSIGSEKCDDDAIYTSVASSENIEFITEQLAL